MIRQKWMKLFKQKRMKLFKRKSKKSQAQALVELALILPALVVSIAVIIELSRLFHAWLAVENGARFGIRYAVTGEYNPVNCAGGATEEGICIYPDHEVPARVDSIHDVAWGGSTSILRKGEGDADNTEPGYFNVVVCKPENLIPPVNTFDSYACDPTEDPGAAEFNGGKLGAPLFSGTIAVDATSSGRFSGDASLSHTTGTGENRLMLVGISVSNYPNTPSVSSATYGGQTLTLVGSGFKDGEGVFIYYLVNPSPGTANVVIDYSSNPNYGSFVGVMTFTGVDQTTPLGASAFEIAPYKTTSASVTVSSAPGELVFDTIMNSYDKWMNVGANQTQRWKDRGEPTGAGSTEPGAASVTMSWSWQWSAPWVIGAVPIKPAADATETPAASNTPTETPTPSDTPTPAGTPTPTSTPTPTQVTGVEDPDFPACPPGYELIGTYDDHIRRDIEPKSQSYPIPFYQDGDVILQGWVMEGHPDLGCPGHPDCDEYQDHEDIIFEIDGNTLDIYEDSEHGPDENAWYFFGPMETTLEAGSHTLTFRHTLHGEGAQSVGFRYSLCGSDGTFPTPTFTPSSTPTPTNTPTNTPINTPTNTSVPPTATISPTPTNTPDSTPHPSSEDPGEPGERIVVITEFNHPLVLPFLSSVWPQLRLTSMREAIVETYFVPPAVGTPPPYDSPTPRPTNTPGPSPTPPAAITNTPTMTLENPRCDLVWISGMTGNSDSRYIKFEIRAYDWIDWPVVVNYHAIVDEVEVFQDPDAGPWVIEGFRWETWDHDGTLHSRYDDYTGNEWWVIFHEVDPPYELMHCYGSDACTTIQYRGRLTIYFGQDLQGEYGIFPYVNFPDYGIRCRKWAPWTSQGWETDTPGPGGTYIPPTASPIPPTEGSPPPTSGANPTQGTPEAPPD